jgi:glycosyltransferase involved in cell wall biosynthesis
MHHNTVPHRGTFDQSLKKGTAMKKKLFVLLAWMLFTQPIIPIIPQNVLLCGVCKDIAQRITHSMKIMEKIGAMFNDYRIIVYENNSSDQTPQLIHDWQIRNPKVLALSESLSKSDFDAIIINRHLNGKYFRPELIARARNVVLQKAMSAAYEDFTYIIWMDMDFILEPNYAGIQEVFETDRAWDAVFAYGIGPHNQHWDWYALRDSVYPLGSETLGYDWWCLPKQLILKSTSGWYPVYSAFGGCGIYKKDSIKDCFYSSLVTDDLASSLERLIQKDEKNHAMVRKYLNDIGNLKKIIAILHPSPDMPNITDPQIGIRTNQDPNSITWRMSTDVYKYPAVCEHVPFHASMIVRGHDKLFINPRLVFHYGDQMPRRFRG